LRSDKSSEKEPLVLISVALNHLTEKLISQSGRFTLVIAGEDQKELAMQVGSLKGEEMDKFERFSIKSSSGKAGEAIIPEGAAAWMACNVESSYDIKGYRMFIGRVVAQEDLGTPPLIWRKDMFFSLKPVK
jgi:flavin reductase (DIM6/NTAB) family NADH-FMN oxidoreductase RutF